MKKTSLRQILVGTGILLLIVLLGGYLVYAQMAYAGTYVPTCRSVVYRVNGSEAAGKKVSAATAPLLIKRGLWPVGKKGSALRLDEMERLFMASPEIRSAECYLWGKDGKLIINLERRTPLLLVQSGSGRFYVDADEVAFGGVSPRTSLPTIDIRPLDEEVSADTAPARLRPIVRYLAANANKNKDVSRYVFTYNDTGNLILTLKGDATRYDLGEVEDAHDIEQRLAKLTAFIRNVSGDRKGRPYGRVSLGFQGQIVCDTLTH